MAMLLQKGENCPMLPNPESVIKEPTPNTLEPQEAVKKKHILPEHIITIKGELPDTTVSLKKNENVNLKNVYRRRSYTIQMCYL